MIRDWAQWWATSIYRKLRRRFRPPTGPIEAIALEDARLGDFLFLAVSTPDGEPFYLPQGWTLNSWNGGLQTSWKFMTRPRDATVADDITKRGFHAAAIAYRNVAHVAIEDARLGDFTVGSYIDDADDAGYRGAEIYSFLHPDRDIDR